MSLEGIVDMISGEAGVIAILVLIVLYLVNGKVFPKSYVEDLKSTNETLIKSLSEQAESLDIISATSVESLENSRVTLRILNEARKSTGVRGEDVE